MSRADVKVYESMHEHDSSQPSKHHRATAQPDTQAEYLFARRGPIQEKGFCCKIQNFNARHRLICLGTQRRLISIQAFSIVSWGLPPPHPPQTNPFPVGLRPPSPSHPKLLKYDGSNNNNNNNNNHNSVYKMSVRWDGDLEAADRPNTGG